VDVEMSFATRQLVFEIIEPLMARVFAEIGRRVEVPFRRLPYAEAIARYGSDKPDLRFGLEIVDFSALFRESEFRVFRQIVAEGGCVRGLVVPGANR
jgi:aspartyl-tRNA synthetase